MIANVSAHRRANAFAQTLDDRADLGPATPQSAEPTAESAEPSDQRRLLGLARSLGEMPKPVLDPEVKVVQRAQLVAAMEAMLQEGAAAQGSSGPTVPAQRTSRGAHRASPLGRLRPRSRWSKSLAAGGLTVGVAAGAFSGVAAASSDALPGDSLYGLKRGMEDIRLDLADTDSARGGLYLDHASARLTEARRLMERGRTGQLDHESLAEIRRTLTGMKDDASEGHRLLHAAYEKNGSLAPMATLSSFTASHRQAWDGLRGRLPVQLADVGEEVNSVFAAIDQDVAPLQSKLPQPGRKQSGTAATDAPGSSTAPGTGRHRKPSPATPSSGESHGHSGSGGSGGTPSPTGSQGGSAGATHEGGLIGGAAGGLVDPPSGAASDPAAPPEDQAPGAPQPDVTLPPLLPGLLPGLGIDAHDGADQGE
ncbi:DUF5667 domain-containing protein [Streptomyces fuscigenes]|uniref:DUF5667 domain-containing protein n=1 Tax=Streptomyces fuscigenes TaxID=1528880 RepID=UPI001F22391C|nr:DUF5667 domain-containing protein [Streptomyces fuscigenes]MCF3964850.1 DUF5667 domain-containing protein [Streptomyces fuscigenes]